MTFEAPRELLDPATRDATLRRDPRASASTACACSSTGRASRRDPKSKTQARASTPPTRRLPGRRRGTRSTACSPPPRRAASSVQLTLTGPVPKWATREQEATTSPSRARRSSARSRPRSGAATATASSCGRSGTSPTTRSSSSRSSCTKQAEVAAHLPQALPRRPARPRARPATAATRCCSARPRRAAPRASSRPLAFLRGALCLNRSYHRKGHCARLDGRRLRPPRVHDARRPALPPAGHGRRHDRRALAAHAARSTAPARRARSRAALGDLPDRVRHPEHARHDLRRLARPSRPSTSRSPSTWPTSTRACSRSRSTCCATTSRARAAPAERYGGFESGLRVADGKAKPAYDAFRLPLAVEAYGPVRRAVGPRAPVGDADAR